VPNLLGQDVNITPQGYETTWTRTELLEERERDAARRRAKWKADKERKEQ